MSDEVTSIGKPEAHANALVITPTYNESSNIKDAIARLDAAAGERVDHLIIDDGSPDGTADVVSDLARGRDDLYLLKRPGKQGLGTAYVTGFRWGLGRGYRAFVEMDADLSHDPADVPRLLDALGDADLVIGSRYIPDGRIENWSKPRKWLSQSGNVYARTLLGFGVRDSTSGFRAYRAEILERMNLDEIRSEGYAFQIEMTHLVHRLGGRIVEVPITFFERVAGTSKMNRRIITEALTSVTRWGISARRKNP